MLFGTNPKPHNGRLYVILADVDGNDVYEHGIVIAPAFCVTLGSAKHIINEAYKEVVDANPDEWSYNELHDRLRDKGFDIIIPGVWVE